MVIRPCPHRQATEDGSIVCVKIANGEREVTIEVCKACPASRINCAHLRFSLTKTSRPAIVVRYGNGRSQVWPAEPPRVRLERGACSLCVAPVTRPEDCAGCALRVPATPDLQDVPAAGARIRRLPEPAPSPARAAAG